jgi:hypothetical protein
MQSNYSFSVGIGMADATRSNDLAIAATQINFFLKPAERQKDKPRIAVLKF